LSLQIFDSILTSSPSSLLLLLLSLKDAERLGMVTRGFTAEIGRAWSYRPWRGPALKAATSFPPDVGDTGS